MRELFGVVIHLRGKQYYQGGEAIRIANKESKIECKRSEKGILLHPQIPISLDRETRHILVMGAIGSGKSQAIWHLLNQVIARGDRAMIYDNKGEFTEGIEHNILFAPWDERTYVWDIAGDCRNKNDARELAARLIPGNDKDPMWSNASRAILTGMIVHLQATKKTAWGFRELADLIPLPISDICQIVGKHNPEGLRSVTDASKTTQSILINLEAFMSVIYDLADAWGHLPRTRRVSIRSWLENKTDIKLLILQGNDGCRLLTRAYINSMISSMTGMVGAPGFTNSRTRKIWLFLDELPQLGKVDNLGPLMATGRSKGIRIVIGIQDISLVHELYGQNGAKAWASMIGTSIYGRVAGGETADWISKRIGSREVERLNETWSYQNGAPTCSTSYSREQIPLVIPSQLQSDLGAGDGYNTMILDAFSKGVYQVDCPIVTITKHREAYVPAKVPQLQIQPTIEPATIENSREHTATAAPSTADKSDLTKRKFKRREEQNRDLQLGDRE